MFWKGIQSDDSKTPEKVVNDAIQKVYTHLDSPEFDANITAIIDDNIDARNFIDENDVHKLLDIEISKINDQMFDSSELENYINREELNEILQTFEDKIGYFIEDTISERIHNLTYGNLFKLFILKLLKIRTNP